MGVRLLPSPEFADRIPSTWNAWKDLSGEVIAASRTTASRHVALPDIHLFVKWTRVPLSVALRGALRNTLFGRSRAAREFEALRTFRALAGPNVAPAPAALGERRLLGFLRESFIATETVPDARPLTECLPETRAAAEKLGRFLRELRIAGLVHGSLWARNLIVDDAGDYRVVDLDRSRALPADRQARLDAPWSRDLARLSVSSPGVSAVLRLRVLRAFLDEGATRIVRRSWVASIDRRRGEVERRLARRNRVRTAE